MDDFLTMFGGARELGMQQMGLVCTVSFLLSSIIATVYRWTFQGLSYSRSFIHVLTLAGVISSVLIMAIGNNLARGLGILGTLALVRFRTPIRDPRDIIFLFATLAIGIASGAAVFSVAVVGTLFFCLTALYLHWSPFASRREFEGLLRFVMPADEDAGEDIKNILLHSCSSCELVALRHASQGELLEYSYNARLVDPSYQAALVEQLRNVAGVSDVNLLMRRSTVEL